ncbi:MAG: hypothetical protein LAT57_11740 [Balneolales bacterium]|nr:hypothetical protein [Balneolales bacterium]
MALQIKLKKIKEFQERVAQINISDYKESWVKAIQEFNQTISINWLADLEKQGLLKSTVLFEHKLDPYIGEYIIGVLEIELPNNKYLVFEPTISMLANYDGLITFYMRGDSYKSRNIYRKIVGGKNQWLISTGNADDDLVKFNVIVLKDAIESWL